MALNNRRIRLTPQSRNLTRAHFPRVEQLIQPLFVVEGIRERESVPGLTGVYRDTPESLLRQVEADLESGVKSFLLFGIPAGKHAARGTEIPGRNLFTESQISALKSRFGSQIFLAVDVCLCSTTEHGQCGILNETGDHVQNDVTVEALAIAAGGFAQAGADCVAPSDMMDGRIRAIRDHLDQAGLERTLILSYAAKFHSNFYGPFRVAADSAPKAGSKPVTLKDRATYQIDPGNYRDALASAERDAAEGADILMVKPGLPYLDVLCRLSESILLPWSVYEVSGEYAAIEILAREGLMRREHAHVEAWTAFIRAGAQSIITYGAREARSFLNQTS